MLQWDYLLEEAKELGLPTNKRRAILREYLQSIILNSLYKSRLGTKLYFLGGTALRFCYRLPRFSEDLDFNANNVSFQHFQKISEKVVKDLKLEGFEVELEHNERKGLYASFINFPEIMQKYGIVDKIGLNLRVKLEVNQPKWPLKIQSQVLSFYGLNYTAIMMAKSSLITEKLCALLSRNRGRDIYDTLFMLRKGFPFDRKILKLNGFSKNPRELILSRLEALGEKERNRLARQVKPFLFQEGDIELVLKAPQYAKRFLKEE